MYQCGNRRIPANRICCRRCLGLSQPLVLHDLAFLNNTNSDNFSGQEASEDFDFEELDSDFDDNYDSEYDINEDSTENENFDSLYIVQLPFRKKIAFLC